jgi:hypothetical protein
MKQHTFFIIPHIVSSDGKKVAAVWYAAIPEGAAALAIVGLDVDMVAVASERRERTRSKGYVVVTEAMPARAPAIRRVGVSNCLPSRVKN